MLRPQQNEEEKKKVRKNLGKGLSEILWTNLFPGLCFQDVGSTSSQSSKNEETSGFIRGIIRSQIWGMKKHQTKYLMVEPGITWSIWDLSRTPTKRGSHTVQRFSSQRQWE